MDSDVPLDAGPKPLKQHRLVQHHLVFLQSSTACGSVTSDSFS